MTKKTYDENIKHFSGEEELMVDPFSYFQMCKNTRQIKSRIYSKLPLVQDPFSQEIFSKIKNNPPVSEKYDFYMEDYNIAAEEYEYLHKKFNLYLENKIRKEINHELYFGKNYEESTKSIEDRVLGMAWHAERLFDFEYYFSHRVLKIDETFDEFINSLAIKNEAYELLLSLNH